ncbi:MAG: exodeoxyribonuclease VII large subunit, partial [Oscillospiraceae bacterium]|nr:exodeoxyribonuclease VII large subunit [Oscillospiraceae bacterium]
DKRLVLDLTLGRLTGASAALLSAKKHRFVSLVSKLDALSPLAVLARGYAIAARPDGAVAKDAAQLSPGDRLTLRLMRGTVGCIVE